MHKYLSPLLQAQPKKNKKERKKKNKQEKKPILPEKGWPNVFLAFQVIKERQKIVHL